MHKAKILIVDDEYIILKAYAKELERAGHKVYTASRGITAVEIALKEKPDIVFTDLLMPEMDGAEVCARIKEACDDIEVILISGYPEDVILNETDFFKAGGRKEWLKKPLDIDELPKMVDKVMNDKFRNNPDYQNEEE